MNNPGSVCTESFGAVRHEDATVCDHVITSAFRGAWQKQKSDGEQWTINRASEAIWRGVLQSSLIRYIQIDTMSTGKCMHTTEPVL